MTATDIRSVTDQRDLAGKISDSAGDCLTSRHVLPFPDDRITVDVIVPAADATVERLPADTFLFVPEGHLSLNRTEAGVNEGLIITAGMMFDRKASTDTNLIRMQVQGSETNSPAIIGMDADAPLSPSSSSPVAYLSGPTSDRESSTAWRSADEQFCSGIRASTLFPVPCSLCAL
ncbi:hypothetical protein [Acetobacter fallax]|uniref:Uncharacterized protein n=1 Tax=Acetobacter fallax TaxID=1737473 RepID=A0ABX0KBT7_9PROT|nr:hypothetical protein [Acetobacter fallax]NHO32643.1 hypothetical protein [Acetobacter fallax]NHO36159.1 hypothetical protein [Acetobacter fallax]